MKKNTFLPNLKAIFSPALLIMLAIFASQNISAQVQNNGTLYIADSGLFYVQSGVYNFGVAPTDPTTGTTTTTRTASTYGVLSFGDGATTATASVATHFNDGYTKSNTASAFVYQIGQTTTYAPAKVDASVAGEVAAAYYTSAYTDLTFDGTVSKVSSTGYWDIKQLTGATKTGKLSLAWTENLTTDLTGTTGTPSTSDITIVGYNGTDWVQIPSTVDTNNFFDNAASAIGSKGSITSTLNIDLSGTSFQFFALGSKKGACQTLVALGSHSTTWDGSAWSNGVPTLESTATISGSTNSPGSFVCNKLNLNADLKLANGDVLEIVNEVTTSGGSKIILASEASIVQRNGASTAPSIELTKVSRAMRGYDYIYWGTPVNSNFFSQLAAAESFTTAIAAAPTATSNVFLDKYKWVPGQTGAYGSATYGWQALTAIENGKGFITMVNPIAPFDTAGSNTGIVKLKIAGTANNGDVVVPVTKSAFTSSTKNYNLLANPYPSAIDVDMFLRENTKIDGFVKLWTSKTAPATISGINAAYTNADYAIYNPSGSVNTSPISPQTISGKIASAQGFMVRCTTAGDVTFTNCMRVTSGNNNFFRTANENTNNDTSNFERNRFKLNMTNTNLGIFSQILIAYSNEATTGYDRLYDAESGSANATSMYTLSGIYKLAINGRPAFESTDVVPVGVKLPSTSSPEFATAVAETYKIGMTEQEGVFANGTVNVFLHDKLNNTYHDFANGDFTFTTTTSSTDDRFEVVYQNTALDNNTFNTNQVLAFIKDENLNIAASLAMTNVEIYDITGKKLQSININNEKSIKKAFNYAEGFYIVKIKLDNGSIVSQKLINKK